MYTIKAKHFYISLNFIFTNFKKEIFIGFFCKQVNNLCDFVFLKENPANLTKCTHHFFRQRTLRRSTQTLWFVLNNDPEFMLFYLILLNENIIVLMCWGTKRKSSKRA